MCVCLCCDRVGSDRTGRSTWILGEFDSNNSSLNSPQVEVLLQRC